MDAQSLFDTKLPMLLAESPDLLNLGAVYVFTITGDGGGVWTVDLKNTPRSCRAGESSDCECGIEMNYEDFQAILTEPARSKQFFYEGRIAVRGSMMLAGQVPGLLTLASSSRAPEGISALFAPVLREKFLSDKWPNELLLVHGPAERLAGLAEIPAFRSIPSLFDFWPGVARVPDNSLQPAGIARKRFEEGASISFDMAENPIPELRSWLTKLQLDLCLPANVLGRCIVYVSAKGTGARMHFDQNANFIIHLHGAKNWTVARNLHVANPTEQYVSGTAELPQELKLYCTPDLLKALPSNRETVKLRRGSVMFLPRGYWHATEATEDSLQLNFTFSQPTWADALIPAIHRRLLRHSHWRALADGAGVGDPRRKQVAEKHLTNLLKQLIEDLGPLDAAEIISEIRPVEAAKH
jgi:50S ribosomal protein L16 3-hydroxylase